MLIAPIKMVIGKKIDAHAQFCHAAKLCAVSQLAVLQGKPVVRCRVLQKPFFHAVKHQFGRFIPIGMGVDMQAFLQTCIDDML